MLHSLDKAFDKLKAKLPHRSDPEFPPQWTPATGESHKDPKYSEAPESEFEDAERFCLENPANGSKLLSSDTVERLSQEGCKAWRMESPTSGRFKGCIGGESPARIVTDRLCQGSCIFSNLPIMAGWYDISGQWGVYYEVEIKRIEGIIAIGSACLPYPDWRFPGWNRLSAGLHSDDCRIFYEDPEGGRDYPGGLLTEISRGDTIGFGYEFASSSVFFTYNGKRLPNAFGGVYLPRGKYDVYAAIGVEGENEFEVNFGTKPFVWKEGNGPAWKVEGHVGVMSSRSDGGGERLPSYQESARR